MGIRAVDVMPGNGCDSLRDSLLDAWRSLGDEELMRQFMRGFE